MIVTVIYDKLSMLLTAKSKSWGRAHVKKSLSPKIFDQAMAFLLTPCYLAFPKLQSSYGFYTHVFSSGMIIDSYGWPVQCEGLWYFSCKG